MSHARDIVFALVLAVVIVALGGYAFALVRQRAMPLVDRNCRLPRRCFPGEQAIPRRIVRLVSSARDPPPSQFNRDYERAVVLYSDVEARMRRAMPPRFLKAYDGLSPGEARENVLRYYEMYENGGVLLGEGVRETNDLCLLIEPTDRVLLSADRPLRTDFLDPTFGAFQTWWFAAVPKHPVFMQTLLAIMHAVENKGGHRAETGRDVFTTVVERLEHQGMRDHRIVCPDANGVLSR